MRPSISHLPSLNFTLLICKMRYSLLSSCSPEGYLVNFFLISNIVTRWQQELNNISALIFWFSKRFFARVGIILELINNGTGAITKTQLKKCLKLTIIKTHSNRSKQLLTHSSPPNITSAECPMTVRIYRTCFPRKCTIKMGKFSLFVD